MIYPQNILGGMSLNPSTSEMQSKLEALRGVYDKAKASVTGDDKEWLQKREYLLTQIFQMIKSVTPEDPPTKSVMLIGRMQSIAAELDAPRLIVAQYEDLQRKYHVLCEAEK
jgi:hypothetical protein